MTLRPHTIPSSRKQQRIEHAASTAVADLTDRAVGPALRRIMRVTSTAIALAAVAVVLSAIALAVVVLR